MREELQKIENVRETFSATFVRYGLIQNFYCPQESIVLKNIKNTKTDEVVVAEEYTFRLSKGFAQLSGVLKENDTIQFDARVSECEVISGREDCGYVPKIQNEYSLVKSSKKDYRFSHPNKISKL